MSIFLKKDQVTVINGGYLVATETEKPVYNEAFYNAQLHAQRVVLFAECAKGKTFKSTEKVSTIADVEKEVANLLAQKDVSYVSTPKTVEQPLTKQLAEEALNWTKFQDEKSDAEQINAMMQDFNVLNDYESFGLYFDESKIVKLSKIYTIEEIKAAITATAKLMK